MGWPARFVRSSIGAKFVLAGTGVLLFLFVIAHLLGNLQVFAGPEAINHNAASLRALGPLLWVARVGLLAVAGVHVAFALRVQKLNEAAKPVAYVTLAARQIKPQTRLMFTSGLVLLGYAVFHLAHFTWGLLYPQYYDAMEKLADGSLRHDVYSMMVNGLGVWWVSLAYVVAMFFLALHLMHGISSVPQTFGWNHVKYRFAFRLLGPAVATLVFAGYVSIPTAILLGALR